MPRNLPERVLSILYRYIRMQNEISRKEVALVKTSYGFKLKEYAPRLLKNVETRYVSINDLVVHNACLPVYYKKTKKLEKQYATAMKTVEKKRKACLLQSRQFCEMEQNTGLEKHIESLREDFIKLTKPADFQNIPEGKILLMMCFCPEVYYEDRDREIVSESNDHYGLPFPAKGGARLFKSCF